MFENRLFLNVRKTFIVQHLAIFYLLSLLTPKQSKQNYYEYVPTSFKNAVKIPSHWYTFDHL